jgi:hypothetical protein
MMKEDKPGEGKEMNMIAGNCGLLVRFKAFGLVPCVFTPRSLSHLESISVLTVDTTCMLKRRRQEEQANR